MMSLVTSSTPFKSHFLRPFGVVPRHTFVPNRVVAFGVYSSLEEAAMLSKPSFYGTSMVMDPIVVPDQIDHVAHAKRRTAAAKDSFLRDYGSHSPKKFEWLLTQTGRNGAS